MTSRSFGAAFLFSCLFLFCTVASYSEEPSSGNRDPLYQALRTGGFGQDAYSVENLTLSREGAVMRLRGTVWFLAPVNGKVPGAVFQGEGTLSLTPPLECEQRQLRLLTKNEEFSERFDELVVFFTDRTYDEIKAGGKPVETTPPAGILEDYRGKLRKTLRYNVYGRLLQDIMGQQPGEFFFALIKGSRFSSKELFVVDPHGVPDSFVVPEEVSFRIYDDMNREGVWAAYHLLKEYADGSATSTQENDWYKIEHHKIDATVEKSGKLSAVVTTTVLSLAPELRVLSFDLYPTLRVSSVTDASGTALPFIQEDKDYDADFYVILPRSLAAGEKFDIVTTYSGKEAISNEGGGNYFPAARLNWYPNKRFGEYSTYDLKFRIPKGMTMVATGVPVSFGEENGQAVSTWKSAAPQAVAGFNFGRFKKLETKVERLSYTVESYTNTESPDIVNAIQRYADGVGPHSSPGERPMLALGTMSTQKFGERALREGELAVKLYSDYFGALPYQRLAMTQQPAANFGQAWPGLVYLPITYFFDSTVRHQLGFDDPRGYFRVVAPHEVAHQWWGHAVGFKSYRDQWISEGFAEASASIYTQLLNPDPKQFREFWRDETELLLEKNKEGFRPLDVGPVTMGYRLTTGRTGYDITRRLIYPKGAFILHMIRMMLWTAKDQDQAFKSMMTDFTQSHLNRPASTEDFKAALEKHMTPAMDMDGNHKMDWFFNQYVYGTALPTYHFESSLNDAPDGTLILNFKLTQSNVDEKFVMPVPVYLEFPNGHAGRLGTITIRGNSTVEKSVNLGKPQQRYKRAVVNYNYDVLADYR